MLAIRLQRQGRSGHAHYRVVVQDSRKSPTSGKVIKYLGHYDPHTKEIVVKKEQAEFYLNNGAQPSDRVARLLKSEGVKLPKWVNVSEPKKRDTRNPEKLRKNQSETSEAQPGSDAEASTTAEPAEEAPKADSDKKPETAEAPAESTEQATGPTEETVEAQSSSAEEVAVEEKPNQETAEA